MRDTGSETRIREFQALCRKQGVPLTVQRRTTYEVLLERSDHPTADQVHEDVRTILPGVSRMTVYRILDLLVRFELVKKVCHPSSTIRFDPKMGRHHHLVCLRCNELIDIEERVLDDLDPPHAAGRLGFIVRDYSVQFRGLCVDCSQEKVAHGPLGTEEHQGSRKRKP